jgi:dCTP deaminase
MSWPKGTILVDRDFHTLRCGTNPCIIADSEHVRPSSLDMPVGSRLWQVSGVPTTANGFDAATFERDYAVNNFDGMVNPLTLTPGSIYMAELGPTFDLPDEVGGLVNAKSSAGRTDLFCTVLANGCAEFNTVPRGYKGKLYMIVVPQSFAVRDIVGHDFVQLRLYEGSRRFLSGYELSHTHRQHSLVVNESVHCPARLTNEGLMLHLDLQSYSPQYLVAIKNGKPISVRTRDNNPAYYFRYKEKDAQGRLFLEPGEFLLASTMEVVYIPPHLCAEMVPYQETQGEIRSHYAGFFDPNFRGSIVCEIRNIGSAPIMLSHGQPIAMCRYEFLRSVPDMLYGETKGGSKPSHYQDQTGVRLAKYFLPWAVAV